MGVPAGPSLPTIWWHMTCDLHFFISLPHSLVENLIHQYYSILLLHYIHVTFHRSSETDPVCSDIRSYVLCLIHTALGLVPFPKCSLIFTPSLCGHVIPFFQDGGKLSTRFKLGSQELLSLCSFSFALCILSKTNPKEKLLWIKSPSQSALCII